MSDSIYVVKRRRDQVPLWKEARPRLGQIDIELTERCNNECIHCCINLPANDALAQKCEMTTEQIKDFLQQAADLGCLQVRFTGGEPLLRPDLQELYIYARRLGMKVLLFTNACLITPQLADLFQRIPPLVAIEITVYGMNRESYEAVTRIPGSFAQFRRGMDILLERNVPFVVKSVLLPQNKHEMGEFEAWAKTIPWMTRPPSYVMFLYLRSRRDNKEKNACIKSLRLTSRDSQKILTRDAIKYKLSMEEFASQFKGTSGDKLFSCGVGRSMCIDAYGRAQPCMGVRTPKLTVNLIPELKPVREGKPISNVAVSGMVSKVTRLEDALSHFLRLCDLRTTNPEYLQRCARCFLNGLCEQCPAKSWTEHGKIDKPVAYLCETAHEQARHIGWLGRNEYGWEVVDWRERVRGKQFSVNVE